MSPCIDGIDPADFSSGVLDPGDDPSPLTSQIFVGDGDYFELGVNSYMQFEVNVSPVNYTDAVEFDFSTSNGTALAGTHYTARTAVHVIIPAGEGTVIEQVVVLKPTGASGDKAFTVTASTPVNATLGDAVAAMVIHYTPVTPPTDPATLPNFNSWNDKITIYNQFADCTHKNECTGYVVGAMTSLHQFLDVGNRKTYDAHKVFSDSGGPDCLTCATNCDGWDTQKVLDLAVSTGVKLLGSSPPVFRKLGSWQQMSDTNKASLIAKVKRAVYKYGAVEMDSIWYDNWDTAGSHTSQFGILVDNGSTRAIKGHATLIIGWNDNIGSTGVGGFHIQSSHGPSWGASGRAWMRYSMITTRSKKDAPSSLPWFRFNKVILKPGG